jgi:hypothetical protein
MVSTPGPCALQLSKMTPQASKPTNLKAHIRLYSANMHKLVILHCLMQVILMDSPGFYRFWGYFSHLHPTTPSTDRDILTNPLFPYIKYSGKFHNGKISAFIIWPVHPVSHGSCSNGSIRGTISHVAALGFVRLWLKDCQARAKIPAKEVPTSVWPLICIPFVKLPPTASNEVICGALMLFSFDE